MMTAITSMPMVMIYALLPSSTMLLPRNKAILMATTGKHLASNNVLTFPSHTLLLIMSVFFFGKEVFPVSLLLYPRRGVIHHALRGHPKQRDLCSWLHRRHWCHLIG